MPGDRAKRVETLFYAALERDPTQRVAFLAEACAGDKALREEVESLLRSHEEVSDFLQKPVWTGLRDMADADSPETTEGEPDTGLPWERLGEFRLIRRLGEGGMGVVYLAEQESLGRQVALKVIRAGGGGTSEAEARFRREIKAIADLQHPNIVTVFGSGVEHGIRYYAMELVSGKGLDELLSEASSAGERIPLPLVLGWIREIAEALDSVHHGGIIHRDVKPSNIRITVGGSAMLMDFGVARHENLATLTRTGQFQGTPYYASPEQVRAKHPGIDARTDIYSLGVTLFRAATGRVPFDGETTEQVFNQILLEDPPAPRRLNRSISRDLETVILTAMEKDPERRYQTMGDFAEDLRRLLAGEVIQARPPGSIRRTTKWVRRHRFFSVAASAALVVLAASVFVQLETSRQRNEKLRIATERFKPVAKAMELSSLKDWTHYLPWTWCLEADIGDPSGHMLCALFHLESGRMEKAIGCLRECIARCRERSERSLEEDAHYLLGIAALTLADEPDIESDRREQLHKEALSELQAAGEFNFMSPDAFVWREAVLPGLASGRGPPSIREIKINSEHFLVRMFVGSYLFFDLYKGGEIGKFERTIDCFTEVLEQRPENVIACTYLGRTYYLLAEHFDFLDKTETARDYLERGLASAGEGANNILHATLGSVHLLRGDLVAAMSCYEDAIRSAKGRYQMNIHNAVAGIGAVYARQGRIEEALEKYRETLAIQVDDMPVRVAVTELHLLRGETDQALKHAEHATLRTGRSAFARGVTKPASAYLTYARVRLARGECGEAKEALNDLYEFTIFSVRDFSLACILIATFPEEWLHEDEGKAARMVVLADLLASEVSDEARWGERISPVSLSAVGANAYLRGRYEDAIAILNQAMEERERWWPEDIRDYIWTEDARDRYLLAMAHSRLAAESADRELHEQKAHAHYDNAEESYRTRNRRFGVVDVIDRVRTKAGEVLGVAQ